MDNAKILRIMVASPGDVPQERDCLSGVVEELNHGIAQIKGLSICLVRWETDAHPGFHTEGPQGLIDKTLRINECDILIGIFWKRFGTPVSDFNSGTEHEFRIAYEAWKQYKRPQIMVYFNEDAYNPKTSTEAEQWKQVLKFKEDFPKEGLWWSYTGASDFERKIRNHLTTVLKELPSEEIKPNIGLLPTGKITILFAAIKDLSQGVIPSGDGSSVKQAINQFHARIGNVISSKNGFLVEAEEGRCKAVFKCANDALACAIKIHNAFDESPITIANLSGDPHKLNVSVGIHTAKHELSPDSEGKYVGEDCKIARKIESLALGGQIIVSNQAIACKEGETHEWKEWAGRYIRNFHQPEILWELLWDGQSRGEPGSSWLPPEYKGGLSVYIPRLTKEKEILSQFDRGMRLVMLHASGGMGKTRLAVACGVKAACLFKNGVFFVSLEKCGEKKAVVEAIAKSCGVTSESSLADTLIAVLRDKEILLILDNYESVTKRDSGRVALYLRELLNIADALRILITGRRQASGLHNVCQMIELDEGMEESEAIELFESCARLRIRNWEVNADKRDELKEIVSLTERIPLAIELSAAWVDRRTLKEIADGLNSLLADNLDNELQSRQGSLYRSIYWSYSLLGDGAQKGFICLGIFPDTFTAEAAAKVCCLSVIENLLDDLQGDALVRRLEDSNPTRYRMHHYIQEFAKNELKKDVISWHSIRQRFVDYFAECIRAEAPNIDQSPLALDWMETEWSNVYACAQLAFEYSKWDVVRELMDPMLEFFQRRGHLQDGEKFYRDMLLAFPLDIPSIQGKIHNHLGVIYQFEGRLDDAEKAFQRSLDLRKERNLDRAKTLNSIGTVYKDQGHWERAQECHEESKTICNDIHDRRETAKSLNNLGLVYEHLNRKKEAVDTLEQSLKIWRDELEDEAGEADALGVLGQIYQFRENWKDAATNYRKKADLSGGDLIGRARALNSLGYVLQKLESWQDAKGYHKEAVEICIQAGDLGEAAKSIRNLKELFVKQKNYSEAINLLEQNLPLFQENKGEIFNTLGWLYEQKNELPKAVNYYQFAAQTGAPQEVRQAKKNIRRVKLQSECKTPFITTTNPQPQANSADQYHKSS